MKVLCFALLLLVGVGAAKRNIPSYIQPCPSSVKEAGPCIQKNVEIMRPYMENGIPELLVPSLNPMIIPKAELTTGSITATFVDAMLYNLHTFVIKKVEFNLDNLVMKIGLEFPQFDTKLKYRLKGKILVLQLDSSGPATGNFTNIAANIITKGKTFERKGKKYMKLGDTKIDISIGGGSMYFGNLFRGNELLTKNANQVINDNFHDVINEFLPVLKETVVGIVIGIANNIFDNFSLDELFPK